MNFLKCLKKSWNKIPLSDYWRWQATTLILRPILPFIKDSVVANAYWREAQWQQKKIQPFHGDAFPALKDQDKEDIFIWAVIDWRYRMQRPQHIAKGLAQNGHRVFYISTSFVNDRKSGFELESLGENTNLYSVRLHVKNRPSVYRVAATDQDRIRLISSIVRLLDWTKSRAIISVVQHPYWVSVAQLLPNNRLIYDCMDYHGGFSNTGKDIIDLEDHLIACSELVIATSDYLKSCINNENVIVVRNAGEYEFFSKTPSLIYENNSQLNIIGYYGAIADWIDLELLQKIASRFKNSLLLLVGADEVGAKIALSHLSNVVFTGEVPYEKLPFYLYAMDVCLLPFKVTPLTLATNPVKVYEYLSAGKPIVSVELPELKQFGDTLYVADTHEKFLSSIDQALLEEMDAALIDQRKTFASQHTWNHRIDEFMQAVSTLSNPLVSIVVVAYNNLELTKACLDSIITYSGNTAFEIIVVDNASIDETPAYLKAWVTQAANRKIILNVNNRGFAAANNQGLKIAIGDYFVLLNNDTQVTDGWLRTLINHLLNNQSIGMIGPVTNNIGNEARLKIRFKNADEMYLKAKEYTLKHMGEWFPIKSLAFFCVMIRRKVYEKVGELDEVYGLGFFEDDDYCRRVEQAGWQLACADDVFVYHQLSASFEKMGKERKALFDKNRQIYESKWGVWKPHQYR